MQQSDGLMLPGCPHQPPALPMATHAAWQSGALPLQASQPSLAQAQHAPGLVLPGAPQLPPLTFAP